jgi:uncharacterized protein YraI
LRKIRQLFFIVLAILVFTGCRLISPQSTTPTFPPTAVPSTPLPTPSIEITQTVSILPTSTSQLLPTRTSTPYFPIQGTITVQNFKLRSGPGFLFDTVGLYDEADVVQVYGRSQGDGWYFVSTSDQRSGWMKADYITLSGEVGDVPLIGYSDADMITGHVRNTSGQPMTDIGVAISSNDPNSTTALDNAFTDGTGSFYLYLPTTLSGDYTIGVNAYGCQSNSVDTQCNSLYGIPPAQPISLPHPPDITIEFVLPKL